jgi:holin-like protein
VMVHTGLIAQYGVRMLVAIVLATWIGLAVTALVLRALTPAERQ